MKNIDVIKDFLKGGIFTKTKNLKNLGGVALQNYNSIIAKKENTNGKIKIIINKEFLHFSKTTQTIINALTREAELVGITTEIKQDKKFFEKVL